MALHSRDGSGSGDNSSLDNEFYCVVPENRLYKHNWKRIFNIIKYSVLTYNAVGEIDASQSFYEMYDRFNRFKLNLV